MVEPPRPIEREESAAAVAGATVRSATCPRHNDRSGAGCDGWDARESPDGWQPLRHRRLRATASRPARSGRPPHHTRDPAGRRTWRGCRPQGRPPARVARGAARRRATGRRARDVERVMTSTTQPVDPLAATQWAVWTTTARLVVTEPRALAPAAEIVKAFLDDWTMRQVGSVPTPRSADSQRPVIQRRRSARCLENWWRQPCQPPG